MVWSLQRSRPQSMQGCSTSLDRMTLVLRRRQTGLVTGLQHRAQTPRSSRLLKPSAVASQTVPSGST